MKGLKENILRDNQLSTSFFTDNSMSSSSTSTDRSTPSTSSFMHNSTPSIPSFTTSPSDTYAYSVGTVAVLAIGVRELFCVQQKSNKKQVSDERDNIT